MDEIQSKALEGLSDLANKIALELVFAEPGTDNGLLPVNSFICAMEETAERYALAQPVRDAVAIARTIIDGLFLTDALFTRKALDEIGAWTSWFPDAMAAIQQGKEIPPIAAVPSRDTASSSAAPPLAPTPAPSAAETPAPSDAESMSLNLESDRELLGEFTNESREHLQNIENGVLILEENPSDADTLNSIFRAFHTFKGGSGFLNLAPINKLAHELESLLDLARQNQIRITSCVIELILAGGDTLERFVEAIELQVSGAAPAGPILIPTAEIRERIARLIADPEAASEEDEDAEETHTQFVQRATGEAQPSAPAGGGAGANRKAVAASVKVDTQKLDCLIDMVGEMVIAQSLVSQDGELKSVSSQRLARNLAQLANATKELQRTAMSLRMVPIQGTFQKMNRLVRDLSLRAGKQIELKLSGEDSELDRTIVEEISDPLVHLIRNAVDHGIESPQARVASGKPAAGTIQLAAFHQGGNFVVQIRDDGAGLNCEKILRKAVEKGIVDPGATLPEKEIFALIFAPGFSTAEKVTDISGRGVGMDVVRRNIEKLRGKIEIESSPGRGATFSMYLPLTLAIIDGLIVRAGEDRYIVPTLSVRESFRPTASMLSTVNGKGEIVNVRGRLLPLLRLKQWLTGAPDQSDPTQGVVVVLEAENAERCVLVDELIGKQEVVIKTLGEAFYNNQMLAGAAILGDGRVGLILDVNALVHPRLQPLSKAA